MEILDPLQNAETQNLDKLKIPNTQNPDKFRKYDRSACFQFS